MSNHRGVALALLLAAIPLACADTVQLKDKAAITGKVLAEKRDQVVVDVGYTVLVVPRSQITKIVRAGNSDVATAVSATAESAPTGDAGTNLFQSSHGSGPDRSVRELVSQLGA